MANVQRTFCLIRLRLWLIAGLLQWGSYLLSKRVGFFLLVVVVVVSYSFQGAREGGKRLPSIWWITQFHFQKPNSHLGLYRGWTQLLSRISAGVWVFGKWTCEANKPRLILLSTIYNTLPRIEPHPVMWNACKKWLSGSRIATTALVTPERLKGQATFFYIV